MEEYENQRKIIKLFTKLKDETKQQTLLQLLNEGIIDLAPAIVAYAQHLTTYKENAQQDIQTLSRAGIDLAEKEIKKIPSIKSLNKKQLKTAQAQTLISGDGYRGTKFGDELEKSIDMSIVDPEWYERCWKLKTMNDNQLHESLLQITEAVWRLGCGTALDLPLDPKLSLEDASAKTGAENA